MNERKFLKANFPSNPHLFFQFFLIYDAVVVECFPFEELAKVQVGCNYLFDINSGAKVLRAKGL